MDPRSLARAALLGAIYFCAAGLAVAFTRYGGTVASLWVASGILIAVLGSSPRNQWPLKLGFCFVGSALATGLFGSGWIAAAPMAAAKMLEAIVAAWLFQRIDRRRQPGFDSFSWFFRFIAIVGVIAPFTSAVPLALITEALGKSGWSMFTGVMIANSLGNLATVSVVLPIANPTERRDSWANIRKSGLRFPIAMAIIIATCIAVFSEEQFPLLFVPVMPLLLSTFIMGREAAALGVISLALIGGVMTIAGHGPMMLIDGSPGARLLHFEFYIAATVLTLLPVAADLHAKRRMMADLADSEARFRMIAEQCSDIIARIDRDGRMAYVSPAITRLCGYDPAELVGQDGLMLVSEPYRAAVAAMAAEIYAQPGAQHSYEWLGTLRDGSLRWFETNGSAIEDGKGEVLGSLHIIRDVHDRKLMEEGLARAALTDPLTGLPNRRAFREAVEGRTGGGQGVGCIAMFDIDFFKRVNDVHGHDAGDAVLCHLAEVGRSILREGDVIARLGGEEFALLMPDTPVPLAMLVCERLRKAVAAAPLHHDGTDIAVTISGGVAVIGPGGIDQAMRAADLALYQAKAGGRDQLALAA